MFSLTDFCGKCLRVAGYEEGPAISSDRFPIHQVVKEDMSLKVVLYMQ
jgi:hypothetical protein